MPAFGDAATPEQSRAVVRYARSLCGEPGWPPGELNFPLAYVVEKAYPEDEVVITDEARGQEFIYEHRLGKRFQMEASARTAFDGLPNSFDGATAALKFNARHSLDRRALASLGVEVTPPLGRQTLWQPAPFFAVGASLAPALVVQGQLVTTWEEAGGVTAWAYRVGVGGGREIGRVVPMVEAGGGGPGAGERTLSFYPQMWGRLSRLGPGAGSVGAELPAGGPEP